MPWPPGSIPVMKVDHATGLSGGMLVASGANPPSEASRAKFGSRPSSMCVCSRPWSMPSIPSTMTFLSLAPPPQPVAVGSAMQAATR